MKQIKLYCLLGILCAFNFTVKAQKTKLITTHFRVEGVCDMCEKRIESAALISGVKLADWNKETKTLKVIYKSSKTSQEAIIESIISKGHDTEFKKASEESKSMLPACCTYWEGMKTH